MTLAETLGLRPRRFGILTLDGDGIRGIIPVVERLEKHIGGPVHSHFDLIAGTSVGAVLGCGFAMGMSAREARDMWINGGLPGFFTPEGASRAKRTPKIGYRNDCSTLLSPGPVASIDKCRPLPVTGLLARSVSSIQQTGY